MLHEKSLLNQKGLDRILQSSWFSYKEKGRFLIEESAWSIIGEIESPIIDPEFKTLQVSLPAAFLLL
ncbi:MAG: hypothetical protein CMI18_09050 [Opitutaceae bacterium]|nr:hypothetical protein [Opitutaceae bacterium]